MHIPLSRRYSALIAVFLLAIGLVLALATDTFARSSKRTSHQASAANIAYARAQVLKYVKNPKFVPPGPAFDASKARGKSVYNISFGSNVPFVAAIDSASRQVARIAGLKWTNFASPGGAAEWTKGLDGAVAAKPDAVLLHADLQVLVPALQRAKKAGLTVIAQHYIDKSIPLPVNRNLVFHAQSYAPFLESGKLLADYVIWKSNGKADVAIFGQDENYVLRYMKQAMEKEFAKYCGSACKLTSYHVPFTDWATKLQSQTQAAITADPNLNWIIPVVDGADQFVVPGVQAAGAAGRVKVASFNGSTFALKQIEDGNIVAMDVAEDPTYLGWTAMDAVLRYLSGVPVKSRTTIIKVFDKSNVKQAGTPPQWGAGYGFNFQKSYLKLWGLKK